MSSSMPIPPRATRTQAASSSWSSSASSSYSSPISSSSLVTPSSSSKGKASVSSSSSSAAAASSTTPERISPRRPSLLGSSLSKSEHIVINLAHSAGPPRLVTCVKSSQGFDWNQELFLPSYAHSDAHELEHKQDPVEEIVLTDEEAAAILPQ